MLITNFAAGELSETLFGRIDLPQYYQGVSLLENFEVIPTGGIERRNGTKRILPMENEGRIIPFILSRDASFLLYLIPEISRGGITTPARIQIYRNGVKQGSDVPDSAAVPLPRTMDEINEVQYAQNYDMMVLVHENYAPLTVFVDKDAGGTYTVSVEKFRIEIENEINSSEELSAAEKKPYIKKDDTYYISGYLQRKFQYPRCVTFFGGRVIFAGTITDPQRIFASRVNNFHNFSTYKVFLTKRRDYVAVEGEITEDPYVIKLSTIQDVGKLSAKLSDYIPNSPLLGNARIVSLKGFDLRLSKPIALENIFTDTQRAELEQKDYWFDSLNETKTKILVSRTTNEYSGLDYSFYYYALIGSSEMGFMYNMYGSSDPDNNIVLTNWVVTLDDDVASYADYNYLRDKIIRYATAPELPAAPGPKEKTLYEANINTAVNLWLDRIRDFMQYTFNQQTYYDTPEHIQAILEQQYGGTDHVYLSFYTETILSEEYPAADDGFTFEIASDMSDAIKWIGQNKNILVGTETAEWVVPAGTNATNVQAILNSRYGSDKIQATSVGDAMCFFQSGRKALVEYYIPQQDNNFRANNMALLSKNMLHESPAFDFDFISAPYTKIFVSREDGIVVALLYERGTGTFAWGRIRTGGHITSVATVPGASGYDDVYLIVEREGDYFLEMLAERRRSADAQDAEVFLDSYGPWNGDAADYTADAVIYDELNNRTYPLTDPPPVGGRLWIGYPYTSRVRSMPVLANDRMKQNIIKSLTIRFNDSFLPRIKSLPNGKEDTISRDEPYSGVLQIPFPGVWDRDVFFELVHDTPTRCRVLAVNAEAN
jgi:hypothetical protein